MSFLGYRFHCERCHRVVHGVDVEYQVRQFIRSFHDQHEYHHPHVEVWAERT